jgi:hypothetical protein
MTARFNTRVAFERLPLPVQLELGALGLLAGYILLEANRADGARNTGLAAAETAVRGLLADIADARLLLRDPPQIPDLSVFGVRACRECGCTDEFGCDGGCWWVGPDLCSSCVTAAQWAAEQPTVQQWNDRHPVGTEVVVTRDDGTELRTATRSEAWTLGGGQAVVKVAGISGGYSLDRVRPA